MHKCYALFLDSYVKCLGSLNEYRKKLAIYNTNLQVFLKIYTLFLVTCLENIDCK